MRIVDVRERSVAISRYRDATIPSGGLTTCIVAVVTDVCAAAGRWSARASRRSGASRRAASIRERFAPRLLAADLATADGSGLDPMRAWRR